MREVINCLTVSGEGGSGKTTVAEELGKILEWGVYGAGQDFRQSRQEKGITNIGAVSGTGDEHDQIDATILERLLMGNQIVEGRVTALVAVKHRVSTAMKVLLVCDDETRYERILSRDYHLYRNLNEVRSKTEKREDENHVVFSRRYGMSYRDSALYDLTINTGEYDLVETLAKILSSMSNK